MLYWDDTLAVNVEVIDEDHKTLFGLINNLQTATDDPDEAWRIPQAIEALNDYATGHFDREEALMLLSGYPGLERHKQEHQSFRELASAMKLIYNSSPEVVSLDGLISFVTKWLQEHIAIVDHAYAESMRASQQLIDAASANLIRNLSLL